MNKPIAITMGDPAGIGPELIDQLLLAFPNENMMIFGDADILENKNINQLENPENPPFGVNVIHLPTPNNVEKGKANPKNAPQVVEAIKQAVHAVKSGNCHALLTAPINKAVLKEGAKFSFPGHTEYLANLDDATTPVMMLSAEGILRAIPASIHIPLKDVPSALNQYMLRDIVEVTTHDLTRYLGQKPKIAIAGLNPHAGENGYIGKEELDWIAPLITELRDEGYAVKGPYSADTMFHERARRDYDVAICMYHDQALIPIKTLAFDKGVNVTLGLSFLRTSPDHGTAYDIAGKGMANPSSFIEAYKLAKKWTA